MMHFKAQSTDSVLHVYVYNVSRTKYANNKVHLRINLECIHESMSQK